MKILLVEDDEPTAWALNRVLSAHHYTVTIAPDGQTGLELAQALTYNLLLLDVILPKIDGITLCRYLRSQGYQHPIILLTSKNTSVDRVTGLDAGADDYLVKPFDEQELAARIRALLRRGSATLPPVITRGELQFDPSTGEVSYGGKFLHLTPKEYSLLELFLLNPRRVFSRSAILDQLWPDQDSPGEDTVTTHIKGLRQKLKAAGAKAKLIETVYGLGYRLSPLSESPQSGEQLSSAHQSIARTACRYANIPQPLLTVGDEFRVRACNGDILPTSAPAIPLTPEISHPSPQQQVIKSVAKIWEKFKSSFITQVDLLEQASNALSEARLTLELQQQAKQVAHKLAGSLGTFGFATGSKLAREIEHLLEREGTIGQEQAPQLSQLLGRLQHELNQPASVPTPKPALVDDSASSSARMLVIDDDWVLTEQLKCEACAWNIRIDVAPDLKTARIAIAQTPPDIILLDLTFPDSSENGLTLLRELASQTPQIPVVAFTGQDSFTHRVEVTRLGGRAFLQKPVAIAQIFKTVTQVLHPVHKIAAKIMVVDDDPIVLTTLCNLLQPWGMEVTTVENPQQFWNLFSTQTPDLLILDLELPNLSGIDLCQVVRNDPQWNHLPILFLTAHTEADLINQAFAVGGDDYIRKPIVEQELVARIIKRLERIRSLQPS